MAIDFGSVEGIVDFPPHAKELLSESEKEIKLNLSVWLDSKTFLVCDSYVVYHNTARGPAKGGIRLAPNVSLEETKDLAERMTLKTALTGIPFGGGKSGIRIAKNTDLSSHEKMMIIREFVHLIRNELAYGAYIPAPDIGTGPREMAVIYGEMHIPECVTGKPLGIGGLPGRKEATGYGVAFVADYSHHKYFGRDIRDIKIAIQGFGNVGSYTAYFLNKRGAKIVCVSDISGGIYNSKGMDIEELDIHVKKHGSIAGFPGDKIKNEDLLLLDVDILIPAAIEDVITRDIAKKVKAKMIVEGANGPTTSEADKILNDKGTIVIPDILANSGGVIASYIEWRSAKAGSITPAKEVYITIEDIIEKTFEKMYFEVSDKKISNRSACIAIAVREIISTMQDRGWI